MKKYTQLFNLTCIGITVASMIVPVNAVSASGNAQSVQSALSESKNVTVDAASLKTGLAGITATDIKEIDEIVNNVGQATLKISTSGEVKVKANDKYIDTISPARLKKIRTDIQAIKKGDKVALNAYYSKLSKAEMKATLAGILLPYSIVSSSVQGTSANMVNSPSLLKSANVVSASAVGYTYNYGQWDFALNGTMRDKDGFSLYDFHFKMRSFINPFNGQVYGLSDFLVQPYIDNLRWYVQDGGIYYKTCGNGNANYRCYAMNSVWSGINIYGVGIYVRGYSYFGAYRRNSNPNTTYTLWGPGTIQL